MKTIGLITLVAIMSFQSLSFAGNDLDDDARISPLPPAPQAIVLSQLQLDTKRIASELMIVAMDEKSSVERRREAVFLLGHIGNDDCVKFLIDNILLKLPVTFSRGFDDEIKGEPCVYILERGKNWRNAQIIFNTLGSVESKEKLIKLAEVLAIILKPDVALAITELEISKLPSYKALPQTLAKKKENLTVVVEYLKKQKN